MTTQFKLSNGDELIAQIIDRTEDDTNIVVRNAMKIVTLENPESGYRYYSFRPWMVYQDDPTMMQLINQTHIVGEAMPNVLLLEQYNKAVELEEVSSKERKEEVDRKLKDIEDSIRKALEEMDGAKDHLVDSDEPPNPTIIPFNRKLH